MEREKTNFNMSIEEGLIAPITGYTSITNKQEIPPSMTSETPCCWISKKEGVIDKVLFYSKLFSRRDETHNKVGYKNIVELKSNIDGTYSVKTMIHDGALPHRKIVASLSIEETNNLIELSNKLASLKKFLIEDAYAEKLVAV